MSWRLITTAAIVLALASTLTSGVHAGTLEQDTPEWERYWSQLRRVYNRVKTADIAYEPNGTRSRFVGEIDPPFVTPDPDQVEVIAFITYGNEAWITNYVLMTKWAKTLPSDVTMRYLPTKALAQSNPHPRAQPLRAVRQNLYHTALAMGVPSWRAHHAVAFFVTRGVWALESTQSQKRYARRLRLGADQFQATRDHPAVRFQGEVADWIELAHIRETWRLARDVARISDETLYTHFPELLIGGKYIVSMTARHDPTETYRMANWAIGQSLNDLDANRHWPRNAEELAAWLAPRDKQILSRRMKGTETEDFPAGVVYEADKQALWLLNADGGVRAIAKLTPSEDGSTHFVYKKNGQTKHFDIWRVTRQLAPWIRPDGTPQLYGAFLPEEPHRAEKDINQQPRGVQLETDTGTWKVHIHANGKATVVLGPSNVLLGEWTINDGYVELTTQDGQTQRWALASTRAERWAQGSSGTDTLKVPPESVRPWDYPERFAAIEPAIIEKPKTASALAIEKTMERIRRKTEMYRQRIKAAQAREEAREAAKRLQSSHEGR